MSLSVSEYRESDRTLYQFISIYTVHMEYNPADIATLSIATNSLKDNVWLTGPKFLSQPMGYAEEKFEIVTPEQDSEI